MGISKLSTVTTKVNDNLPGDKFIYREEHLSELLCLSEGVIRFPEKNILSEHTTDEVNESKEKNSKNFDIKNYFHGKKYEHLFFDFQGLIHVVNDEFSNEINYFIRLCYYIKYVIENDIEDTNLYQKKLIANYIIYKYSEYFEKLFELSPNGIGFFEAFNLKKDGNIVEFFDFLEMNKHYKIEDPNGMYLLNNLENIEFKNKEIVEGFLAKLVYKHTRMIIKKHIEAGPDGKYPESYIFFDGISCYAKMRKEISVKGSVTGSIRGNLYDELSENIESIFCDKNIREKFLPTCPNIDIDSILCVKIRELFNKNTLLNVIINIPEHGEAEYLLFSELRRNFVGKRILLYSADSDSFLLSIINTNLTIDILKQETVYDDTIDFSYSYIYKIKNSEGEEVETNCIISPYYINSNYININIFLSKFGILKRKELSDEDLLNDLYLQKSNLSLDIKDIGYIITLFGTDFTPAFPNIPLDLFNFNLFLESYNNYKDNFKKEDNYHFISIDGKLIINNLIKYFFQMNKDNVEEKILNKKLSKKNAFRRFERKYDIRTNLSDIKLFNFYFLGTKKRNGEFIFKDWQIYLKNNYLDKQSMYVECIEEDKFVFINRIFKNDDKYYKSVTNTSEIMQMESKIINYLEGCYFLGNLYFNNTVNYLWYYNFVISPSINEIVLYLKTKYPTIFLNKKERDRISKASKHGTINYSNPFQLPDEEENDIICEEENNIVYEDNINLDEIKIFTTRRVESMNNTYRDFERNERNPIKIIPFSEENLYEYSREDNYEIIEKDIEYKNVSYERLLQYISTTLDNTDLPERYFTDDSIHRYKEDCKNYYIKRILEDDFSKDFEEFNKQKNSYLLIKSITNQDERDKALLQLKKNINFDFDDQVKDIWIHNYKKFGLLDDNMTDKDIEKSFNDYCDHNNLILGFENLSLYDQNHIYLRYLKSKYFRFDRVRALLKFRKEEFYENIADCLKFDNIIDFSNYLM